MQLIGISGPARIAREVTGGALRWVRTNPAAYRDLARRHAAGVRPADGPA